MTTDDPPGIALDKCPVCGRFCTEPGVCIAHGRWADPRFNAGLLLEVIEVLERAGFKSPPNGPERHKTYGACLVRLLELVRAFEGQPEVPVAAKDEGERATWTFLVTMQARDARGVSRRRRIYEQAVDEAAARAKAERTLADQGFVFESHVECEQVGVIGGGG